ncbi:alpha/beta hydrolase [Streptosporangium lutulentum]|uniref:Dienelactone hydrolase n=1 Tax=Streptosporangium lutulentum TaxID=1461250 RepID=A0ABT9QB29_9ACTN|nr:alpha/beta fold hydrolase [Streptosporangium lutulentum]MDP9843986.1 dienelactone hydrolase [Streptosporangium lutulentum]
MKPLLRRNGFWLALSLVLCLISGIGASFVQTAGGSVTIKDMRWETRSGHLLSALLFKPDSATAERKAPAVVVSHGWYNTREMQDLNFVELARRGYVVVSIDMYGHGNSDYLPEGTEAVGGTGMYDAVRLVSDLPYVDASKIGVSGHSFGARAVNFSVAEDNAAPAPLIAAALLVDNDPTYRDPETKQYANIYGTRDVGLIQAQYDEFFFRSRDADGNVVTVPRDYPSTPNAQSFLHFGADPAQVTDKRVAGQVYDQNGAMRVLYSLNQTHPWGHTSATAADRQIQFFQQALGAPNPIAAGSQVWQFKVAFNTLGLIGFGIFLVAFAQALLGTRAFAGLRNTAVAEAVPTTRKGLAWFWGGLVVAAVVSAFSYVWLSQRVDDFAPAGLPQEAPYFIGLWAAVNGVVGLIIMALAYRLFGRGNGQDLRALGVLPGWRAFFHGIGLALTVVVAAFALVFVVDYFFTTDFRLWVVAVKTFTPDKIGIALLYLPLFLIYFFANSLAINSFNRFTLRGKEGLNTAVLVLFNSLAPLVLVIVQYGTFFVTGDLVDGFGGIYSIWLFPVVVILAVAAVVSRKIYRTTGNPYIGGFINAAVVVLISVTNTLTMA